MKHGIRTAIVDPRWLVLIDDKVIGFASVHETLFEAEVAATSKLLRRLKTLRAQTERVEAALERLNLAKESKEP